MNRAAISIKLTDVTPDKGVRFTLDADGGNIPCFVIQVGEQYFAYRNHCPHLGTELDWEPGVFLDDEQQYIVCSTHWAYFEPHSGHCVSGPCVGQRLMPLEISIDGANLRVNNPAKL